MGYKTLNIMLTKKQIKTQLEEIHKVYSEIEKHVVTLLSRLEAGIKTVPGDTYEIAVSYTHLTLPTSYAV